MFIYKTLHKDGKYYIGRCSRKYPDTYLGSGKWVRSIKDKTTLTRIILSTHETFEELCLVEEITIQAHINDPMCMNWNNKSVGFGTGRYNPSYKGMVGHTHSEESKKKISESKKYYYKDKSNHPMYGKETSNTQKQRTAETNSCQYKIIKGDNIQIVKNMKRWCTQHGYSDIVFHRRHKEGKPYRGMTYTKLPK